MNEPWVMLLAGGEGTRLRELTRNRSGTVVPKQFCHFGEPGTLLRRTLDRARSLTSSRRVVPLLLERHRGWWQRELADLPSENLVVQTENRGTAAAIASGLDRVLERDRDAAVVVLPSDQEAEDNGKLEEAVRRTARTLGDWPDHIVLLGMEPEGADPDYGWIVPGLAGAAHTHAVERFVEKPEALETARLATSGALINAFIVAARAGTLRERMRHSLPEIFRSDGRSVSGDFSRDFLERDVSHVRVLRAPRCGWTDLGTPVRLRRWLQRAASVSRSHPERERRHVA